VATGENLDQPTAAVVLKALEALLARITRPEEGTPKIFSTPFRFGHWDLEIFHLLANNPKGLTMEEIECALQKGMAKGPTEATIRMSLSRLEPARSDTGSSGDLQFLWDHLNQLPTHRELPEDLRPALDVCLKWNLAIQRTDIPRSKRIQSSLSRKCYRLVVRKSNFVQPEPESIEPKHSDIPTPLSCQRRFEWRVGSAPPRRTTVCLLHRLPSPHVPLSVDCNLLPALWKWRQSQALAHLPVSEIRALAPQLNEFWKDRRKITAVDRAHNDDVFKVLESNVDDPEERIISLKLQQAKYRDYEMTNRSLNRDVTVNGERKKFSEILRYNSADTCWDLCNPLAASLLFVSTAEKTEKAFLAVQNRLKQVGGGLWTATVVGTVGGKDKLDKRPSPSHTARREAIEEVGYYPDDNEIEWLGFGCRLENGHYSLLGEIKTDLTLRQIRAQCKEAQDDEVEKLVAVDLVPDKVIEFLEERRRQSNTWTPFLEVLLALALWRRYPDIVWVN
jgi:hypothetical protein